MKFSGMILSLILLSNISYAGIITTDQSDKTIENVKIAHSAIVTTDKGDAKLDLVGSGIFVKKVLITNIKVFVAQMFVDNAGKFVRTPEGALNSMDDMNMAAFNLTYLFSVDGNKIMSVISDALDANNVDTDNEAIQEFLDALKASGKVSSGKTMTIVLKRNDDGTTKITFESPSGQIQEINGDKSVFKSIASIWLGNTADDGSEKLKASILEGK